MVKEGTRTDDDALAPSRFRVRRAHMRLRDGGHVDPAPLPLQFRAGDRARERVVEQALRRVDIADRRGRSEGRLRREVSAPSDVEEEGAGATYPPDKRRVERDEVPRELGLVRGDELPRGALGERLGGEVDRDGPRAGALARHVRHGRVVPARLVVLARRRVRLADRGGGGGEDDPLHARAVLQGRVQDRRGAPHGGDDELCVGRNASLVGCGRRGFDVPSGSVTL